MAYLSIVKYKDFDSVFEFPDGLLEQADKLMTHLNEIIAEQPGLFQFLPIETLNRGFTDNKRVLDIVRKGQIRGKKIVVRLEIAESMESR